MRGLAFLVIVMVCCDARYVPDDGIFAVAETMPEYELGMQSFEEYISSSLESSQNLKSGTVFVSFIVNETGEIKDLKVARSLSSEHDSIALNIIKNAPNKWKPGLYNGKPVQVKMTYPIHF